MSPNPVPLLPPFSAVVLRAGSVAAVWRIVLRAMAQKSSKINPVAVLRLAGGLVKRDFTGGIMGPDRQTCFFHWRATSIGRRIDQRLPRTLLSHK